MTYSLHRQGLSTIWHDPQIKGNHKGCPYGVTAPFSMRTSLNSDVFDLRAPADEIDRRYSR